MARTFTSSNLPDGSLINYPGGFQLTEIYRHTLSNPSGNYFLEGNALGQVSTSGFSILSIFGLVVPVGTTVDLNMLLAGTLKSFAAATLGAQVGVASMQPVSGMFEYPSGTIGDYDLLFVALEQSSPVGASVRLYDFKLSKVTLNPAELLSSSVFIPDNNVNYPNRGCILSGLQSTSVITTVMESNIPAGDFVNHYTINYTMDNVNGSDIKWEIYIEENGSIVDSFILHQPGNSRSASFSYISETSQVTNFKLKAKRLDTGFNTSDNISIQSYSVTRLDLSKSKYTKHLLPTGQLFEGNLEVFKFLETPNISLVEGGRHIVFGQLTFKPNHMGSSYATRVAKVTGSGTTNIQANSNLNMFGWTDNDDTDMNLDPASILVSTLPVLTTSDDATNFKVLFDTSERTGSFYNQVLVRPGSGVYIFDLLESGAPPIEYEPNYYLEIS